MSGVGLVSGIDTATLISQLMAIERRPVNRLEKQRSARQAQLTMLADLKSKLSTFRSKVTSLKSISAFSKVTATSSDEDVLTVSAKGSAQAGKHTLTVSQLAQAQQSVSQGFSAFSAEIGTGTFRISIGGEDHDIEVNSNNNTLSALRDAINSLDAGVTASIANVGGTDPYRLIISSDDTGTENAHTITTVDWAGTAPTFTTGENPGEAGQAAKDALFTFDGLSVVKASNEVTDLLTGVTVFLKDVTDTDQVVNLNLSSNVSGVKDNIKSFVDAYNEVVDYVSAKLEADDTKNSFALSSLRGQLQTIVSGGNEQSSGVYQRFSQFGISQSSGKLEINDDTLDTALENHFDDVVKVFTTQGRTTNAKVSFVSNTANTAAGTYDVTITGTGENLAGTIGGYATTRYSNNYLIGAEGTPIEGLMVRFDGDSSGSYGSVTVGLGVMERMERLMNTFVSTSNGVIKSQEDFLNNTIRDYDQRIAFKENQLEKVELGLKTKFSRLETMLSQLQTSQASLSAIRSYSLL